MRPALTILPLAALATAAHSQPPPKQATDIQILDRMMLSVMDEGTPQERIARTTTIPYLPQRSCYNWAIRFTPVDGEVVFSEDLILPGPAEHWGTSDAEKTVVATERASATTERRFDGGGGLATAGWCVADKDPVGTYKYVIYFRGREVARFNFIVGDLH